MAQWCERTSSTNVAQVRFQHGVISGIRLSLVDRSRLAPRVILRVTKTTAANSMATRIGADVASL